MPKQINYASLFTLRKDGVYQAAVGNPRRYLYSKDPKKLYEKVQAANNAPDPTFKEIAELWHDWKWECIGAGTKSSYASAYRRAVDACGAMTLEDVSAGEINSVLMKLQSEGFSRKTISTQRSVFKLIFDYAIVEGYTRYNPAVSIRLPRGLPKEIREAPEDDVLEIIRKNTDKNFGIFPMFLLYTGFRKAEALALQWQDIDFESRTITCNKAVEYSGGSTPVVKEPKTKAGRRTVPLLDDLYAALKRPKHAKNTDLVFAGSDGKIMRVSAYRRRWAHWCKDAGLTEKTRDLKTKKDGTTYYAVHTPDLTAHQLRHAYATILFEANIDELTAKELLGHADIATTRAIYTHLRQKKRGQASGILNEHFASNYEPMM